MKMKGIALFGLFAGLVVLSACPQNEASQPSQPPPQPGQPPQPAHAAQPGQPAQQTAPTQPAQAAQAAQPAQAATGTVAAASPNEGKRLFMMGCANCHGPDGTGAMMRAMLPKIGDLTSAEMHARMKDEDIAALVTTGRDKMPPFGGVFKPEQIKQIIAYVRTLKKG